MSVFGPWRARGRCGGGGDGAAEGRRRRRRRRRRRWWWGEGRGGLARTRGRGGPSVRYTAIFSPAPPFPLGDEIVLECGCLPACGLPRRSRRAKLLKQAAPRRWSCQTQHADVRHRPKTEPSAIVQCKESAIAMPLVIVNRMFAKTQSTRHPSHQPIFCYT